MLETIPPTNDPLKLFSSWLEQAKQHADIKEPTAMTLATVSSEGKPSARIVLLKEYSEEGFVFFTNLESRKSEEIKSSGYAALCFYWMPLDLQIRITGCVVPLDDAAADRYFASRERAKQIGAWSSKQSQPMTDRNELEDRIQEHEKRFEGQNVPRPSFWSGWRVVAEEIEFWEQKDFRLHHRLHFYRTSKQPWSCNWLYP